MRVFIKLLVPEAQVPTKAHGDDYCYDCYAVSEEEIAPNVWKYGLGFAVQPERYLNPFDDMTSVAIKVRARSSVYKTGMILSNCEGVVDEGYRGEISAVFYHVMPNMPRYKVGDKICQLNLELTETIEFILADKLTETERGEGGYGSTGR